MRRGAHSKRSPARRSSGPPAWLVFLVGVALVFGLYYVWQGLQNFIRTGGMGVQEATERASIVTTATADRITRAEIGLEDRTPRPSNTPVPECQDFVVDVPNAIVREAPNSAAAIITSYNAGTTLCVLSREGDSEWFVIDQTPGTRRLDLAYMHESVIRAVNPTPTPTITPTPLPTVTPAPTEPPTLTPSPRPTQPTPTRDPGITDTPEPTIPATRTPFRQNA
jgi:hypothetical protein